MNNGPMGGRYRTCRLVLSQEPTEGGSAEFPPPFLSRSNSFISGGLQLENLQGELHETLHVCSQGDGGQTEHQLDPLGFFKNFTIPHDEGEALFQIFKNAVLMLCDILQSVKFSLYQHPV